MTYCLLGSHVKHSAGSVSRRGFENIEKGQIFFSYCRNHRTRPSALFLENVDHLVTHDKGATFSQIIDMLENKLKYKVIGVTVTEETN